MSAALLRALRAQLLRDGDPFKRELFHGLLLRNPAAKLLYQACARWRPLGLAACLAFYCLHYFRLRARGRGALLVFPVYPAEEKSLALLPHDLTRLEPAFSPSPISPGHLPRVALLLARLLRRHELYQALRAAQLMAYLHRLPRLGLSARTAVATTDSNPSGIALLAFARAGGRKTAFLSHGQVVPPLYPLRADLALLLGKESQRRYEEAGGRFGKVLFQATIKNAKQMQSASQPRVGIFLGKDPDPAKLTAIARHAREKWGAKEIFVRPHPSFPLSGSLCRQLSSDGIQRSNNPRLEQDLPHCGLALAGNTTSHLEILLAGIPSVYFPDRDGPGFDRYGFVRAGLVPEWNPALEMAEVIRFYGRPEWEGKLGEWLSLGTTESEVKAALATELKSLI